MVGIILFIIGVITGIQTPLWVGCILAALTLFLVTRGQEIEVLLYFYFGAAFVLGMIAGDVYVFVFYPELRPEWLHWNPFVPPGA
tara:strand:- start:756 stop:1010 length:255 start_codon:yes stop_codon:yes gene_type:complete